MHASGYEVYDRLSPSFARYLETLEAVHEARFFHQIAKALGNKLRDGERGSPGNVGGHLEAVHPVIRFVNCHHSSFIVKGHLADSGAQD